ncbi:MAG: sulfurtransferase [Pseudomonadota bacterium]
MYHTLINIEELAAYRDKAYMIVDCRYDLADQSVGKQNYNLSHIPGAIYLDLMEDLSGPPITNKGRHPLPTDEAMNQLFANIGITSDMQVFVYDDQAGAFAARLWWMLKHMQHECVAVVDGGWQAWKNAGHPTTNEVVTTTSSDFQTSANQGDVVLIDDLETVSCLIDSRDPARYRGELEPIDPIAGHIPGAKNRFWQVNLTEQGVFKDRETLYLEWQELLGSSNADDAVVYCGSGVTACHNLLSASHAGLPMPRLYAGSWSEWSRAPGKSIASGD